MTKKLTTVEVAALFRVEPRTIVKVARSIGVGADFGGRAGFRFDQGDIDKITEALRPAQPVTRRRRAS